MQGRLLAPTIGYIPVSPSLGCGGARRLAPMDDFWAIGVAPPQLGLDCGLPPGGAVQHERVCAATDFGRQSIRGCHGGQLPHDVVCDPHAVDLEPITHELPDGVAHADPNAHALRVGIDDQNGDEPHDHEAHRELRQDVRLEQQSAGAESDVDDAQRDGHGDLNRQP